MNERPKKKEHGSALEKAVAVLEAVTEQPQAIGLPDLAARLGMPRQTVHRILQNLEGNQLVARDPSRERFSVGPRLSRLALNVIHSNNQTAPIRVVLQGLVDDIKETCNIGVLDGGEFVYLERIECDWSLRVHLQAGSGVPAYCTSGGKALLAYLPNDARDRLLTSLSLKRYTDKTITDRELLEQEFDRTRERGYATNDEEFTVGILGAAVPIMNATGQAVAALACHAPAARVSLDRMLLNVPKLQEAAKRLAKVWGVDRSKKGIAA